MCLHVVKSEIVQSGVTIIQVFVKIPAHFPQFCGRALQVTSTVTELSYCTLKLTGLPLGTMASLITR